MTRQDSTITEVEPHRGETAPPEELNRAQAMTLLELFTELAYRKWFIAKVTGSALITSVVVSILLPNHYTATTRIMPPRQTQSEASLFLNQVANSGAGPLAALAGGGLGLKNPDDLYIGLLNSRPVSDAIIRAFDLAGEYGSKDMSEAREELADNTRIDSERSGLIAISVTDRDKKRAAAMANAYTAQLRILSQGMAVTEASQRRLFYEQQLAQASSALVAAEVKFQQVQQTRGLVSLDAQSKAMIEGLASTRGQIAAKEVQLQALRSYSTEHNPDVAMAERELSALEGEEAHLEQRNGTSHAGGLGLGNVPDAGREYLNAEHDLGYRQTLYDLLIKQYDAARLDEAKDAAIIQVVEPAIEPDRRSSPKRAVITVFFTLLGFFAAGFCVLATSAMRRARRDPETNLQLSILGNALSIRGNAADRAVSSSIETT